MKGMQKISRGGGFRGAVDYALDRDGENSGQIVGGNMDGETAKELSAEFRVSRSMRPDCKKPVWHNALRLPAGERIDPEKWVEIADDYMNRMGFSEDHQRVYVIHDDPEGQHLHIIASRIALDGSLYYGQNENLASTQHIAELEREHGLTISPGPGMDSGQRRRASKGEIEMSVRTGEAPPKLILQNAIDAALAERPTTGAFIERLQAAGITPRPNIASTGRMNGFSFELDGIAFKASSLGKAYSWNQLQKRGLDYEQDRDREILSAAAQQGDQRADQRTAAAAGEQRRPAGPADRAAGPESGDPQRRGPRVDHAAGGDRSPAATADSPAGQRSRPEVGSGSEERQQGAASLALSHGGNRPGSAPGTAPAAGRDLAGMAGSDQQQRADSAGADRRIHDLAAPAVQRREAGNQGLSQADPGQPGADSQLRARAVAPHIRAKQEAWREQHQALQAPGYRLTLTARAADGLQTYNHGKGKGPAGGEKLYTAEEVAALIPQLSRQNARGYDIYITPINPQRHYVVLDDTDPDRLQAMQQRTGITPALVQESSPGNLQAIIVADKAPGAHEQSNANFIVQGLNKAYGDPKFTGVVHPFRLSGFMNQKPKYEQNGKRPIVRPRPGVVECRSGADPVLNRMLDKQRQQQAEQEQKQNAEQKKGRELRISEYQKPRGTSRGDAEQRYMEYARSCVEFVRKKGWPLDWSRVDFFCCKEMLKDGYFSEKQIEAALKNCSPELFNRHRNVDDYAVRTVLNAAQEPDVIAHLERQRQRELTL